MNITDQTLSAFLDAELPAAEMEAIRELIATDEAIAERVEAFAVVDAKISSTYSEINDRPMPAAITALLSDAETAAASNQPTAKILAFPRLHRWVENGLKPAAVAACFTFVMGYGLAMMNISGNEAVQNEGVMLSYQQVLSNSPSGEKVQLGSEMSLQVNLSFDSQQGEHCRQYTEQSVSHKAENIACRSNNQWQLVARHPVALDNGGEYRTASGPGAIDAVIDQLIAGPVKSLAEETELISGGWQAANTH
jgi:hypothetical protein